jgi:hypothetical protein
MKTIDFRTNDDYVSIASPEYDKFDDKEIVIAGTEAILQIDYPLKSPVSCVIKSDKDEGFTKAGLIHNVSEVYHKIYKEEKKITKVKIIPESKRHPLINRNTTNGKYGIWGHDIGDLVLDSIEVIEQDGKIYLQLTVES